MKAQENTAVIKKLSCVFWEKGLILDLNLNQACIVFNVFLKQKRKVECILLPVPLRSYLSLKRLKILKLILQIYERILFAHQVRAGSTYKKQILRFVLLIFQRGRWWNAKMNDLNIKIVH